MTVEEDFEKLRKIALHLDLPEQMGTILKTADKTGLLYTFERTQGREIVPVTFYDRTFPPVYAIESEEERKRIVLTDITNTMHLCRMYHEIESLKGNNKPLKTVFSSLENIHDGDWAFVTSGCVCSHNVPKLDAILSLIPYGEIFCNINLNGCGIPYLVQHEGLSEENARKLIEEYANSPLTKSKVRNFTENYLKNRTFQNTSLKAKVNFGEVAEKVHFMPYVPTWLESVK